MDDNAFLSFEVYFILISKLYKNKGLVTLYSSLFAFNVFERE